MSSPQTPTTSQPAQSQTTATKPPPPSLQTTLTDNNELSSSLLSSPTSHHPHNQEGAAREHALAWKPALDRRQSWSAQDHKHEQQRKTSMAEGAGREMDGGFSEV